MLRVKALHINLRKSTEDTCFINYKMHTFFFLSFSISETEMRPTNDDDTHTVSMSQAPDVTVRALGELGCHSRC